MGRICDVSSATVGQGERVNQDIIYNFRSEIHKTGSRTEITVKSSLE